MNFKKSRTEKNFCKKLKLKFLLKSNIFNLKTKKEKLFANRNFLQILLGLEPLTFEFKLNYFNFLLISIFHNLIFNLHITKILSYPLL
jgi:hypothetical protein